MILHRASKKLASNCPVEGELSLRILIANEEEITLTSGLEPWPIFV